MFARSHGDEAAADNEEDVDGNVSVARFPRRSDEYIVVRDTAWLLKA